MKSVYASLALIGLLLSGSVAVAAAPGPLELVQQTTDTIRAAIQKDRAKIDADRTHAYALIDEIILPHFDFRKMSSWVLGKHWRKAKKAEKRQFIAEFKMLLVRTYSNALIDNVDYDIEYKPVRAKEGAKDVSVNTSVIQPGSFPIPITYSMYFKKEVWKVYDVNIDGISLVTNYRRTFAKEIRENGIASLIDSLSKKNSKATNG